MQKINNRIVQRIRRLREKGYSMPEIKKVIPVGYGSIYRYIQGITIKSEFHSLWRGKRGGSKKRKIIAELDAQKKAHSCIRKISMKEQMLFVSALYWGEGSKRDFGFINSDPQLIKVFMYCMRHLFHLSDSDFRISIRVYEDLDRQVCLQFWSDQTGIQSEHFVRVDVLKGKKYGKLQYGLCRIRIKKGGNLLKYIMAMNMRVSQLLLSP